LHSKQLKGVRKELYYSPEEFSEKATVIMPQTPHKEIGKRENKQEIRKTPISTKQNTFTAIAPSLFLTIH